MASAAIDRTPDSAGSGEDLVRAASAEGQGGAGLWHLLPLTILAYSIFLPLEMRIVLNEQIIYPSRAALFLVMPWILRELTLGRLRTWWPDFLVYFAALWMIVSFVAVYGPVSGVVRGGALALDLAGPYMLARLCIREIDDFRRLLVLLAPGAFLAGASMLVESISGVPLARPLAASIFGSLPLYEGGAAIGESAYDANFRFGLLRASGPFAHSIYAGLFLSSLLPLYFMSGLQRWPKKIGLATAVFSLFSISSAALLGIVMSVGLIAGDWIQRAVRFISWKLMIGFGLLGLVFVQVASQNGLIPVLIRMTLNPQTGYYRLIIWRFGVESVENNPLFGIGFAVYERPDWMNTSIDSHWLMLAIRHGLAVPVAMLVACIVALTVLGRSSVKLEETDRRTLVGLAIALACLVVAGFTVAFLGGILTWFLLILGAAFSLTHPNYR